MHDANIADWYRLTLVILSGGVFIAMLIQTIFAWKRISDSQKLFVTGALLTLLFILDASREALEQSIGFRYRLIFWTLGMLAYFAYLLEPKRKRYARYDNPDRHLLDPAPPYNAKEEKP